MYRRTSTVSFRLIEDKVLRIHDIPELVLFAFESPWDDLFSTGGVFIPMPKRVNGVPRVNRRNVRIEYYHRAGFVSRALELVTRHVYSE